MDDLERFLELVRRELGCDDAHFEYGGRDPRGEGLVWAQVPGGWRVVALDDDNPGEAATRRERQAKLEALIASFEGIGDQLRLRSPRLHREDSREVDEALAVLAEKAKAVRAVVIDEDSPVLWGSSESPPGSEDVETAMWIGELADSAAAAGLDLVELVQLGDDELNLRLSSIKPRKLRERLLRKLPLVRDLGEHRDAEGWGAHFLTCRAIAAVRRAPENHEVMEDDLGWLARDFAGIYHVILVYDGPFSEIGAAGVMLRALPAIETLVLSLPPVDPPPKGARVLQFRPR